MDNNQYKQRKLSGESQSEINKNTHSVVSYVLDILNEDETDTKTSKIKKGIGKYRSLSQEKKDIEAQSEVQEFYDCIEPFDFQQNNERNANIDMSYKQFQPKSEKALNQDTDECKSTNG